MTGATAAATLYRGFEDPVFDAQATFRTVLEAMAKPGTVRASAVALTPPPPLFPATAALGLTLFDFETPVWFGPTVRNSEAADYFRFHTGCPAAAAPDDAAFALFTVPEDDIDLSALDLGKDEYPDRSATAVVQTAALDDAGGIALRGPGIPDVHRLDVAGLPRAFWQARCELETLFPRGVDLIFACGRSIAAVPRSTRVEA